MDCSANRQKKSEVSVEVQVAENSSEEEVDGLCEGAVNGGSSSVGNTEYEQCGNSFQDDAHRNTATNTRVLSLDPHARENCARVQACEVCRSLQSTNTIRLASTLSEPRPEPIRVFVFVTSCQHGCPISVLSAILSVWPSRTKSWCDNFEDIEIFTLVLGDYLHDSKFKYVGVDIHQGAFIVH